MDYRYREKYCQEQGNYRFPEYPENTYEYTSGLHASQLL
jgi:hypothetical protein